MKLMTPERQNAHRSGTRFGDAVAIDGRQHEEMRHSRRSGHKAPWRPINGVGRFVADETAATAIEYCLIASGIALGIFVAVAGMEARINAEFTAINSSLR
jgi:pilus assembly protein Flp/PilA